MLKKTIMFVLLVKTMFGIIFVGDFLITKIILLEITKIIKCLKTKTRICITINFQGFTEE